MQAPRVLKIWPPQVTLREGIQYPSFMGDSGTRRRHDTGTRRVVWWGSDSPSARGKADE